MGRGGLGIGIGAGGGALSAAVPGIIAASAAGGPFGWGILAAYIGAGAALGAGMSAASLLLNKGTGDNKRKAVDLIQTNQVHILPVPIAFGRFRAGGNWVNVGNFWVQHDNLSSTPGRTLRVMNAVLAICEGGPNGVAALGNIRQGGELLEAIQAREKLDGSQNRPPRATDYIALTGTNTQLVDPLINDGIANIIFSSMSADVHTGETASNGAGATATVLTFASSTDALVGGVRVYFTTTTPDPTGAPALFAAGNTVTFSGGASGLVTQVFRRNDGFAGPPYIPLRNTSILIAHTVVGEKPSMPDINIDGVGPDLTIIRSGSTGESPNGDVVRYAFFDSYSDSFYYTIASSSGTTAPFGLVGVGRQGQLRHHTPPPSAVVSSVTKAWYLGRHDVLVMQDPSDSHVFWLGTWAILPGDSTWERHTPLSEQGGAGYGNAILIHYLDEVAGILHTLHFDGVANTFYVMRWWLLTGRVVKQIVTLTPANSYNAFLHSPDLNCYVFCSTVPPGPSTTSKLEFVDVDSGAAFQTYTTTAIGSGVLGLCVTGQLVGMINVNKAVYYDPVHGVALDGTGGSLGPFGSTATDATVGSLGGVASVCQNSFTGHVTLGKNSGGQPLLINFIPSVPESVLDLQANGTSGLGGLPDPDILNNTSKAHKGRATPNFQDFSTGYFNTYDYGNRTTAITSGWVRDWSYRAYNGWSMVALQGHSSLAAAAWAILVDESNLDSRRYGAGLNAKFFNLGSFEGLHWFCTGAIQFANPGDSSPHGYEPTDPDPSSPTYGGPIGAATRYAERIKFDLILESEQSVATFISDEILMTCQGYRTTVSGVMHVAVEKSGLWPSWSFTEKQILEEEKGSGISSMQIAFAGRTDVPNKIRVQYRDLLNEYAHDYAEVADEFDINARGKIQLSSITAEGCSRYDSAQKLAQTILDNSRGGRRQVRFKAAFQAHVLVAGDVIEVSNAQCALKSMPAKVVSLVGDENKVFEVVALEHRPTLDALLAQLVPGSTSGSGPSGAGSSPCPSAECPSDSTSITWVQQGVAFPAGTLTVTYSSGTYRASGGGTYSVAGYEVITRAVSGGAITVLGNAPAVAGPWPDQGSAEQANLGRTATFTLASGGLIGLRRIGSGFVGALGSNFPTYSFCIS